MFLLFAVAETGHGDFLQQRPDGVRTIKLFVERIEFRDLFLDRGGKGRKGSISGLVFFLFLQPLQDVARQLIRLVEPFGKVHAFLGHFAKLAQEVSGQCFFVRGCCRAERFNDGDIFGAVLLYGLL